MVEPELASTSMWNLLSQQTLRPAPASPLAPPPAQSSKETLAVASPSDSALSPGADTPPPVPPAPLPAVSAGGGTPLTTTTTAATSTAASVEFFRWAFDGFHSPVPETVIMAAAIGAVPIVHALGKIIMYWLNKWGGEK